MVRVRTAAGGRRRPFSEPSALDRSTSVPRHARSKNEDRACGKACCYGTSRNGKLLRDWSELRPAQKKGPRRKSRGPVYSNLSGELRLMFRKLPLRRSKRKGLLRVPVRRDRAGARRRRESTRR